MISSIHPFRKFQIEKDLRKSIKYIKKSSSNLIQKDVLDNSIGVSNFPINVPLDRIPNSTVMQTLVYNNLSARSNLIKFIVFWDYYKQIFKFNQNLTKLLSFTEIKAIPWSEIKLPYKNFYISLGNYGQEIFTPSNQKDNFQNIIDGAYIELIDKGSLLFDRPAIIIRFTSTLVSPKYLKVLDNQPVGYHYSDPIYEYILLGNDKETVGEALQKGEQNFLSYCEKMDLINYEDTIQFCKSVNITINDIKLHLHKDKFLRSINYIKPLMAVIFNCIFYLTQYPEFITEDYPEEAPTKLVEKYKIQKDENIKKKLNNKINSQGYSKVKFVSSTVKSVTIPISTNRELSTHWRRGHWRNQAFGNNFSKRKYIWIHPIIVRKDKGSPYGHIYNV